jgi:hypothetical protein
LPFVMLYPVTRGRVAELADAPDSGLSITTS